MKYFYFLLLLTFSLLGCKRKNDEKDLFKRFDGVEETDSGYKLIDKALNDNQQKAALVAVLVYYGVPVKCNGDSISIPESEFKRHELPV